MAWLIGDSFDFYAGASELAAGMWDSQSTVNLSGPTRFGTGQSIRRNGNGAATFLSKAFGSNEATLFVALAYYHTQPLSGTAVDQGVQFLDGSTAQCTVCFLSNGDISLKSGGVTGTVLATYAGAFGQTTWGHFQIKVVIDGAAGSIAVRKDGVTSDSFSATGLNTRGGTANNYANKVALVGGASSTTNDGVVDDLLVYSGSGAAPNGWVGDIRAMQLMASADTAQRDFSRSAGTTNYTLVDEAINNGDTDYVYSSTVNHEDLYDLADLGATPTSIVGVQSRMFAKKSDAGARNGQIRVKSGATEVGGTDTALSTSYTWLNRVDAVDPNTSAAWTASAVNALQVGPKCTA